MTHLTTNRSLFGRMTFGERQSTMCSNSFSNSLGMQSVLLSTKLIVTTLIVTPLIVTKADEADETAANCQWSTAVPCASQLKQSHTVISNKRGHNQWTADASTS